MESPKADSAPIQPIPDVVSTPQPVGRLTVKEPRQAPFLREAPANPDYMTGYNDALAWLDVPDKFSQSYAEGYQFGLAVRKGWPGSVFGAATKQTFLAEAENDRAKRGDNVATIAEHLLRTT